MVDVFFTMIMIIFMIMIATNVMVMDCPLRVFSPVG